MSNNGPIFPKKSENPEPDEQQKGPVIERSDDPNFGKRRGRASLPTMQGKPIGCSTGMFLLILGIGLVSMALIRLA